MALSRRKRWVPWGHCKGTHAFTLIVLTACHCKNKKPLTLTWKQVRLKDARGFIRFSGEGSQRTKSGRARVLPCHHKLNSWQGSHRMRSSLPATTKGSKSQDEVEFASDHKGIQISRNYTNLKAKTILKSPPMAIQPRQGHHPTRQRQGR